jgi:predicted RNase H-like HicB family nuclease
MTKYNLYVESGPRRQKTMVHVLDLLGCIAQGATTEAALAATSEAIRGYLRFLRRHGEAVNPESKFTTVIAKHVMEGSWLGNGDPTPGFAPDFQPLTPRDLDVYLKRWGSMQADLLQLIRDVPQKQMISEPEKGRSLNRILEHIAEADGFYLRYLVGKVDGLSVALRAVRQGSADLPAALTHVWQVQNARLKALTEVERKQKVRHGQVPWTARRGLRRMLEHDWEHLIEIAQRLGKSQAFEQRPDR